MCQEFYARGTATFQNSIDWFKGKITGKSDISWETLWIPVDFPFSQPIENRNMAIERMSFVMNSMQIFHNDVKLPEATLR